MKRNLGSFDRLARFLAAFVLFAVAAWAPLPAWARVVCGVQAAYLVFSALAGSCIGYRLMGKSTCALKESH